MRRFVFVFFDQTHLMLKQFAASFIAASLSFGVHADTVVDSIRYADTVQLSNTTLTLNGAGLRKKVFFKVYAAGLYLPSKAQNTENVLSQKGASRVRLGLLRDVSASTFVDALKEGLIDNTPETVRKEIAPEIERLIEAMNKIGDVKKQDLVDFDYSGASTSVSVNGKLIASDLGGKALYDAVLRIWLGDKAIDAKLKSGLLGR